MYALHFSAEGDCYRGVPPDPGIAAAALGASASGTPPGTAPAEALHTFTLESDASRCFFRDNTTLTPLPAPVPVRMADPSGGPDVASSSTVLSCPAVSASGQVAASCSCRDLSHQTLLWHHRLGHPSLPRLRGMHYRLLISSHPRSLPPLPHSPAPPCLPCVEGRQRAAPHSSSFPPTTAPLQTLHMDVWGPARVSGQGREHYFLLVVDEYTRYTTVFPLLSKGEVVDVLIPWICTVRLQLRERFGQDLPLLRLHFDRGGEFSSDLLREFCRREGIRQSYTLPDSPQQNGIAERRIGLVMEVARTSMIHAAAPHFLWPFEVRYAAHRLNLWPRVSLPETSPTLRWTGKVGDASVFRVWGSRALVCDTSADKLSARAGVCRCLLPLADVPSTSMLAGGARTRGIGAVGTGGVEGAGAGDPTELGAAGAGGSGAGGARAGGAGAGGIGAGGAGAGGAGVGGTGAGGTGVGGIDAGSAGAGGAGAVDPGGTVRPQPYFVPLLQQLPLPPASPLPAPSPYTEHSGGLTERREPVSRLASPVRPAHRSPPPIPGTHAMALCPSSIRLRVPLPAPPESSLPEVPDPKSDRARATSPVVSRLLATTVTDPSFESAAVSALVAGLPDFAAACRVDYATAVVAESESTSPSSVEGESALGTDDFECLAAAVPRFASMLFAPEGDPDAPDIPTPCSYAEAIMGHYSSQWQTAMDAEIASWKSTGTYVDEVLPPGANIVNGMWIFRVKRPPGSPPAFKARYVARGFS
ncbi:unnamed protein product [Closterium sp. NIES-54]